MAEISYVYLISPTFQFMNISGKPLVDGYVNIFISGTRSKYYAYSDFDGTLHPFNIPLNALGSAVILVSPAHSYDIYVYNSLGVLQMSRYNVTPATGEGTVITDVMTITSQDETVEIRANSSTEYDLSVARALQSTADTVLGSAKNYTDEELSAGLANKKDKQTAIEFSGSATKTVKKIAQNADGVMTVEFEDIDLPQEAPNVNVTSTDSSITVNSSIDPDTNTKTFDLSVADGAEVEYGRFIASDVTATATLTKTRGDLELSSNKIQLKKGTLYHFTIRGSYVATTLSNTLSTVNFIEYSTFNGIPVNVDNSISDTQFFEISFDVYASNDIAYPITFSSIINAKISSLEVDVHSVVAGVSGGSSSSSDNDKVAVAAGAVPNYLENVLVSDSDLVSLVKVGNQLRVNVNTQYSADPKLSTMNESQIDSSTDNYGSYALQTGVDKLVWNDTTYQSYQWLNASVYQMMRLSDGQGTITRGNLALCGSLAFSTPAPCFNLGIFDTNGTLLGQSGLKYYGTDFNSDEELCSVEMVEATDGSLSIKRNTRYIIMLWSCGVQIAGLDRSTAFNYAYDQTLRQNLQGTTSQPVWPAITDLVNKASVIPYITFGASALS